MALPQIKEHLNRVKTYKPKTFRDQEALNVLQGRTGAIQAQESIGDIAALREEEREKLPLRGDDVPFKEGMLIFSGKAKQEYEFSKNEEEKAKVNAQIANIEAITFEKDYPKNLAKETQKLVNQQKTLKDKIMTPPERENLVAGDDFIESLFKTATFFISGPPQANYGIDVGDMLNREIENEYQQRKEEHSQLMESYKMMSQVLADERAAKLDFMKMNLNALHKRLQYLQNEDKNNISIIKLMEEIKMNKHKIEQDEVKSRLDEAEHSIKEQKLIMNQKAKEADLEYKKRKNKSDLAYKYYKAKEGEEIKYMLKQILEDRKLEGKKELEGIKLEGKKELEGIKLEGKKELENLKHHGKKDLEAIKQHGAENLVRIKEALKKEKAKGKDSQDSLKIQKLQNAIKIQEDKLEQTKELKKIIIKTPFGSDVDINTRSPKHSERLTKDDAIFRVKDIIKNMTAIYDYAKSMKGNPTKAAMAGLTAEYREARHKMAELKSLAKKKVAQTGTVSDFEQRLIIEYVEVSPFSITSLTGASANNYARIAKEYIDGTISVIKNSAVPDDPGAKTFIGDLAKSKTLFE